MNRAFRIKSRQISRIILRAQEGQALIIALILILATSLIIAATLSFSASGLKQGTALENRTSQLYSADGGVNQAIFWINNPSLITVATLPTIGNTSSLPVRTYNNISFKTYVKYLSLVNGIKTYQITSYAGPNITDTTQPTPYSEIVAQVATASTISGLFDNAMTATSGNITMGSNSSVISSPIGNQGNIFANGSISLSANANVAGDASATGTTTTSGNATAITKSSGDPTRTFTDLTSTISGPGGYETQAEAGQSAQTGTLYSGSTNLGGNGSSNIPGPNTYISGPLTVGGNYNLTVTGNLYINGALSINSNANFSVSGNLYVNGSVTLSGNNNLTLGGTLYVGGSLSATANESVILGGPVYVTQNISMGANTSAPLQGGYPVVAGGTVALSGNTQLSLSSIPLVISLSSSSPVITTSGNGYVSAILYAPYGTIDMSGNSSVYGSVVGTAITCDGNNQVDYITNLSSRNLPGGSSSGTLNILTWAISRH